MSQQAEPLRAVADKYKLQQEQVLGLVELVEGRPWEGLKQLLLQSKQQRRLRLEGSDDMNEMLRAQGGIAALHELESNIRDVVKAVENLRRLT